MKTSTLPPSDSPTLTLWALSLALEARLAAALAPMGLSVAGFRLIGEVSAAPDGLRQSELALRLGVRPPTVSVAVKRLEELGLVTRVPDPKDPRARLVRVSPSADMSPGLDLIQAMDRELFDGLDAQGRAALSRSLSHLQRRLARSPE